MSRMLQRKSICIQKIVDKLNNIQIITDNVRQNSSYLILDNLDNVQIATEDAMKIVIFKRHIVQIYQDKFTDYVPKVIFTLTTYSLDALDNVQIIIQIFSNTTFEKKIMAKNYSE